MCRPALRGTSRASRKLGAMSSATTGVRDAIADDRVETVVRAAVAIGLPVLVIVAALWLAIQARMPPIPSDQLNYLDFAHNLPNVPDTPAVYHQFQRIGLVAPLAVAIKLFGYTSLAYYAVPIMASVALAFAVFLLGALLFNRVVGLAASLLAIGNSAIFVDLAAPLPDVLSAALFCWAMVLAIALRLEHPRVAATHRRRNGALLGIGILLGWSYLTREFIVLLWPLVPIVLFRSVGFRGLAWVALPLALVGIGELALNSLLYQDPLARVRSVLGHGEGPMSSPALGYYRDQERLWYVNRLPEELGMLPEGGWLTAALVATVAGAIASPSHRLLLGWVASLGVPLLLLGGVLDPSEPMLRLSNLRYWFPIVPAISLGGVGATWLAARWLLRMVEVPLAARDVVAGILALAAALVPLSMASDERSDDPRYVAAGAVQLDELRSWLATSDPPVERLWADSRTRRIVPLVAAKWGSEQGWSGEVLALSAADEPRPGDHVLLYSADRGVCGRCRNALEPVLGSPASVPASWTPAFATDDGIVQVFEVASAP